MNLITVIPARGGSKSIPLKNIQKLNEKPLIAYSIEYSLCCTLISNTVVSTDSERIASVAEEYGAEVPFLRPDYISGDDVQDYPVIEHSLYELEKIFDKIIDAIVWLRPTSPLRPQQLIEKSVELLNLYPECSSVRSVVTSSEHPYRQWLMNGNYIEGFVKDVYESYNLPRQKLPEIFFQSGDIEVVRRETIINGSMSGNRVIPLIINREDMLDIDYLEDLTRANVKSKKIT